MILPGRRGTLLLLLGGAALFAGTGCATVEKPKPEPVALKQTETLLALARQIGWKEVEDLLPLLQAQATGDFPGIAALTADLGRVAAAKRTPAGVPPIDAVRLVDHNPHFWAAYFEIAPGDPLMAMLHVGLLLAAGEVVRADEVATLEINFGRMEPDYRKELVRLDVHAQLVLQGSRVADGRLPQLRQHQDVGALARGAEAALRVWPANPDALSDLALSFQPFSAGGPPAPDSPAGRALAALRKVDPFFPIDPVFAQPDAAALLNARRWWLLIDGERAIGDDRILAQFSSATQAAAIDELALVARSLLSGWSGETIPPDEGFARKSLQRLVGEEAAAKICARAFAEGRQWVGLNTENDAPPVGHEGVSVHPQLEQRLLVQVAEASYWIESGLSQGRDLASNFGQRGTAWAQLRQEHEAVADFRRCLQMEPENRAVRYRLAVTLSDEGDFPAADSVFAEGAKRAAPDAGETQAWGNHLFKQGRFSAAEAAYARAARLDPGSIEARIMRHLTRLREGKPAETQTAGRLGRADPWEAAVLEFLAGRIDEKGLFGRLEPQGGLRYSEQECELFFVRAQLELSRGEIADARLSLHSCLGTGATSVAWYGLAWHELRRLDRAHPPPPPTPSSGGCADDQPA
jgi:tetratricopeptide (TPR) repeat protein